MAALARALRPEVVASLRQAFAGERAQWLPALVAALDGSAADLTDARRAAHSIGTSAYVVGEPDLAVLARDVEQRLHGDRTWQAQGALLVAALERWSA